LLEESLIRGGGRRSTRKKKNIFQTTFGEKGGRSYGREALLEENTCLKAETRKE